MCVYVSRRSHRLETYVAVHVTLWVDHLFIAAVRFLEYRVARDRYVEIRAVRRQNLDCKRRNIY